MLGRVKAGLIDGTVGAEAGEVKVYTRVGGVVTLAATFDAL